MTSPVMPIASTRFRWPWFALAVALLWAACVRVPLVLNARSHLDSDLAVDGLTLDGATRGDWRWHYPGTPHMGIPPVLLSLPQALVWGASPETLVSGGLVAYSLVIVATFALAWRVFCRRVAVWSLVPLAFSSVGVVWLSSRITGGHLLTVAWQAMLLLLLFEAMRRADVFSATGLGLACGLGLYLDRMLLPSALVVLMIAMAALLGHGTRGVGLSALLALATAAGYLPAVAGQRSDPYDAYGGQFESILTVERGGVTAWAPGPQIRQLAIEHLKVLGRDCLPRLLSGRRLPGLQMEPHPAALAGAAAPNLPADRHPGAVAGTSLTFLLAATALLSLFRGGGTTPEESLAAERAMVRAAILLSVLYTTVAFVLNRHIYNSDNYRYLVLLLVPWAVGFGLLMSSLCRRGAGGAAAAIAFSALLGLAMTWDTATWYSRFGWLDGPRPVVKPLREPALAWLDEHSEIDGVFGDYWDVYRLSLLTGARVAGVPYPNYPNRFPEVSSAMPEGRPRTLIARPGGLGAFYLREAQADGARLLHQAPGLLILDWPRDGEADHGG